MGLPTTNEAISAAEEALGRRFPDELRAHLLRDNGGAVRITGENAADDEDYWQVFPVWDESSRETIRRSANHIVKEQESAREWPGFPEDAVAFAEDGGGNYLVLDGESGILLWFHETAETFPVEVEWPS